jgi:hypothetical protein
MGQLKVPCGDFDGGKTVNSKDTYEINLRSKLEKTGNIWRAVELLGETLYVEQQVEIMSQALHKLPARDSFFIPNSSHQLNCSEAHSAAIPMTHSGSLTDYSPRPDPLLRSGIAQK